MADDWHIEPLDRRRVSQKRRRQATREPQPLDTLPAEWRELLIRWVQRGGNSRWETLRKEAGATRVQLSDTLLDWLLRNGWAAAVEYWQAGEWWPQQVELLHLQVLRAALNLPDKEALTGDWSVLRSSLIEMDDPSLDQALSSLDALPPARAIARGKLLAALGSWRNEQRNGTRRDFALYVRGATKAVSSAEWRWLEDNLDLAEFGIERHTPLLLLSAPVTLITTTGRIDLAAAVDFTAITPATLESAHGTEHSVAQWCLVENRTSFERMARNRETDTGVIWLPGFPPGWWREAISHLLALVPAPAAIACDPDPAGVAIALQAGALWQAISLDWQPWRMDVLTLQSLANYGPLNAWDRDQIVKLRLTPGLPAECAELLDYMQAQNIKGEQEGAV